MTCKTCKLLKKDSNNYFSRCNGCHTDKEHSCKAYEPLGRSATSWLTLAQVISKIPEIDLKKMVKLAQKVQ